MEEKDDEEEQEAEIGSGAHRDPSGSLTLTLVCQFDVRADRDWRRRLVREGGGEGERARETCE